MRLTAALPVADAPMAACAPPSGPPPPSGGIWQPPAESIRLELRRQHQSFALRKADPDIKRSPVWGWMVPVLIETDDLLYGRWDYWHQSMLRGGLIDAPIPPIDFGEPNKHVRRMLEQCFDAIPGSGSWQGWSSTEYINFFLDWLLYGLGHNGQREAPAEPRGCEGASDRLYQMFQLHQMQLWPDDYLGEILAENAYGKRQGFYPTPMSLVTMMAAMVYEDGGDHRAKTVCDPCTGTGRMLLVASNYSCRLYGMDIDATMVKCTMVHAALYAPWMYRPFPENWFPALPQNPEPEDEPIRPKPAPTKVAVAVAAAKSVPAKPQLSLFE